MRQGQLEVGLTHLRVWHLQQFEKVLDQSLKLIKEMGSALYIG
jgi:hypothetical protein